MVAILRLGAVGSGLGRPPCGSHVILPPPFLMIIVYFQVTGWNRNQDQTIPGTMTGRRKKQQIARG